MTSHKPTPFDREQLVFGLILILAFLHGLLYVVLVPPWQHYDEPNHFENVWLTANLDHLPTPEDYSPKLSRQVVKSMIEHGFFSPGGEPAVGPSNEKIHITGYSQLSEPPFYYLVASLPLHLILNRGVDAQLYAARMVSLLFFLLTVLAGYGIASELAPKGHALRWMLPLSLALLPSFADLMTAVNNDVAAIGLSSVFFFLSVRLIRSGFSVIDFLSLCLISGLIILSKITAIAVMITLPFTFLFSILQGRRSRIAWGISLLIITAALAVAVRWDDAFAWYRNTTQPGPTRVRSEQAPWGDFAFSVQSAFRSTPKGYPLIYQNMPVKEAKAFAQKTVTFGYWVWAEQAETITAPLTLRVPGESFIDNLDVDHQPEFHARVVTIPVGAERIWIDFNPYPTPLSNQLFYDGLVLVEGQFPVDQPPVFDNSSALTGVWAGQSFTNILVNPSAEKAGPRASPLIDELGARFSPDSTRPSLILASLVDPYGSKNLYPLTARHLFQTFWARFGWGNVGLLGGNAIYLTLLIFSMILCAFSILRAVRLRSSTPWEVVFVFGMVAVLSILMALTRAVVYLAGPGFYIATARYFYPVVIPLMLLFVSGWQELEHWLSRLVSRSDPAQKTGTQDSAASRHRSISAGSFLPFFLFFMGLSVLSLISVIRFFY